MIPSEALNMGEYGSTKNTEKMAEMLGSCAFR
jgi:hypothetical protein